MLEAANITPWLQALFDEVEVGNEDTYPSSDKVEKVITQIAELLEKGNQTAPDDIRPVWLRATANFVETGRLAAVQYDIAALPQDDLRASDRRRSSTRVRMTRKRQRTPQRSPRG